MKRWIACLVMFVIPFYAMAQQGAYVLHVDLQNGKAVEAGLVKLGTLKDVRLFGARLGDVDANGLFAVKGGSSLGVAGTKYVRIADNLGGTIGLSVRTVGDEKINVRFGVVAGLAWRF